MRAHRRGMTIMELMTVLTILGIVAVIAFPKAGKALEGAGMRSAKQEVSAYLASARAIAVQNGATTVFERTGNQIRVTLEVPGQASQVVMPSRNLNDDFGVQLDGLASMRYNARGFAAGLSDTSRVIRLRRGARMDSVCVMGLGKVMKDGCTL